MRRSRRLYVALATLLVACGAVTPGPPECEEPPPVRPCPDGGLRDGPADVSKYIDAPPVPIAPAKVDASLAP